MAKKTSSQDIVDAVTTKKNINDIKKQNDVIQKMINNFKSIPIISSKRNDDKLDTLAKELDDIIDKETGRYVSKSQVTSGKDLALFFNSLMTKAIKGDSPTSNFNPGMNKQSFTDLMNDQTAQAAMVLSERYKNINSMYEDIRMVTEQLSELATVVDTMRDTITNNDNLVSDLSRIVSYGEINSDDTKSANDLDTVYAMEKATGIKNLLKKQIIPNTLKYGNYFVYTQPYKEVFAKFKAYEEKYKHDPFSMNARSSSKITRVGENYTPVQEDTQVLTEFYNEYSNSINDTFLNESVDNKYNEKKFVDDMESYFEGIDVINDDSLPLMEDSAIAALSNAKVRDSILKTINNKKKSKTWNVISHSPGTSKNGTFHDGVLGVHSDGFDFDKTQDKYLSQFADVSGVYIKTYDPGKVIPVYMMDYCIGYYVLYESAQKISSHAMNAIHTLSRTSVLFQNDMKKNFEEKLIGIIADRICKSIDKDFLKQNSQFKELIANAISYDDFYKKSFKVQFVSSSYITHFKINEDPDTHMGTSVLKKSLYYAMLYLTLLNFKIIMITTRSMDTRMFLIHVSEEDQDISGRVNKVIGQFKQNQISYNDFGSVRGILSKVGKGHDIGIPMTPSGDRAFDVEVMQGQQYDLDTPLTDMLRKGMISNTGCPSAMMSAMDELDFARQLPMLHANYVARMIGIQEETEPTVTELYQKLLYFGGYETNDDKLDSFEFKWSRPKSINITNTTEMISNADQMAEFMIKVIEGENTQSDPRIKDKYFKYIITKMLLPGVYDWSRMEQDLKEFKLDLRADMKEEQAAQIKAQADQQ